ncbi:MAG TPA: ABC transporter permease [Bacteroidota bacterium]|nr:ABC transporter permease [Bacteroidota bacterium]
MAYVSFIARRYLFSHRTPEKKEFISFLTVIAIAGIALGVAALVITLTILAGFESEIKTKVAGFTTHIQITAFQAQVFPHYDEDAKKIARSIPEVRAISPFVSKEGMVSFGKSVEGVVVKGVDPANDVTSARKYLVEGAFDVAPLPGGMASCVVGRKLLRTLGADCGDTIAVFGLTGSYEELRRPRILPFVVKGVYESGMSEYDDVYLFTDIASAQTLFALGPVATGYDLLLHDLGTASAVAEKIQDLMGYPYYPRTVFQLYHNLFTWLELQKRPVPIILGLIILVATVNIIGTLLMIVMEKTNQIGILKSMGARQSAIRRIFFYEGLFIGIAGTVIGNTLGFGLCWLQQTFRLLSLDSSIYFMSHVPILFRWESFVVVSLVAIALTLLAALLPSAIAGRLDPLRSIRYH